MDSSPDDQIAAMGAPSNNAAREETSNLLNLPNVAVAEILSRLPLKTVVAAKCVCKSWLNLVSGDTDLAKLHRQRSPTTEILLRSAVYSTTLYIGNIRFHHNRFYKIKDRLLFNLPRFEITSNDTIIWEKKRKNDLVFVNSSNGLLCFHSFDSGFAAIINPITREFITVPLSTKQGSSEINPTVNYRLGFSEKKNRFKLLRVMYRANSSQQFADICTFEKGSKWREIGDCPHPILQRVGSESVFLEHKLHYDFAGSGEIIDGIAYFDFEKEQFGVVPIPSQQCNALKYCSFFGVFGVCLFLSWLSPEANRYEIWAMKEYGVEDSWEKMFSLPDGFQVPLKQLENGEILVFAKRKYCLASCSPGSNRTTNRWYSDGLKEVSVYSPILLRLKDALAGYEACIHDVKSR